MPKKTPGILGPLVHNAPKYSQSFLTSSNSRSRIRSGASLLSIQLDSHSTEEDFPDPKDHVEYKLITKQQKIENQQRQSPLFHQENYHFEAFSTPLRSSLLEAFDNLAFEVEVFFNSSPRASLKSPQFAARSHSQVPDFLWYYSSSTRPRKSSGRTSQ